MRKKALKKIPKPDQDKMAIFYGAGPSQEDPPIEKKPSTIDMATVDNTSQNTDFSIKTILKILNTHSQQLVYVSLYKRSHEQNQEITNWTGYRELARENNLSIRTVQRAIDGLQRRTLIEKTAFINAAEQKGTKYKVFLPTEATTVDTTTVDNSLQEKK